MVAYRRVPMQPTQFYSLACCCHFHVGVPMVCAGPAARMDAAGYAACEECGRRLNRCKGKLYSYGPGKICHNCYNNLKRPTTPAPPPPSLPRSKRPLSDSGQSTATLTDTATITAIAAIISSNVPTHEHTIPHTSPPLPLHLQSTWSSHGWTLSDSSRRTCAAATAWLSLIKSGIMKNHSHTLCPAPSCRAT